MSEPNEQRGDESAHQEDRAAPDEAEPANERAVREEEAAAAREAGRIGGRSGMEGMDPAERASAEHGGGVAEGFEQSEERLRETASHGDGRRVDPVKDAPDPEQGDPGAEYGEGDELVSTETDEDTQGTPGDLDGSAH